MDNPYLLIVIASAVAGLSAGFVMHRSDFCVAGMFRDLFLFRNGFMLRQLLLLVVVSMVLFEAGRLTGLIPPGPFPLLGAPALTSVAGGLLFGIGMVLAGGCVVGTLYKLGAGSLLGGVALIGMVAGSALYAEWHPWWSRLAAATTLADDVTLPQFFALPSAALTLPLAAVGALYLHRHYRRGGLSRPSLALGHIAPWRAALVLAAIGFGSYLVVGMPLGITTAYAKAGAGIEALLWPEHTANLAYFGAEPLNYIPPFAASPVSGGAGPQLDAIAAIQYPLITGIVLGAFISARRVGEFRLHYRVPAVQYASALTGGLLLGAAARMTPGCNIWHLWGGVPVLASQSLLFLAGLLPGAWVGTRLIKRFVIR